MAARGGGFPNSGCGQHLNSLLQLEEQDVFTVLETLFAFLSAPELVRLRSVCRGTKKTVDDAWTWNVLCEDLNKANRFNVVPHSDPPKLCVLSAEDSEEDEDFDDFWKGEQNRFAATDPRIQPTYAGLTPYEKFVRLFAFAQAAVQRLQKHFGISGGDAAETQRQLSRECCFYTTGDVFEDMLQDDGMDDYGSGDDALDGVEALDGYGELALLMGFGGPFRSFHMVMLLLQKHSPARFHTMMHLIALNVAAQDLSAESGTFHFRKDFYHKETKEWMILDTGSPELTAGSFPPLHRAIGGYLACTDNWSYPPSDAKIMGSDEHLQKLLDGLVEDRTCCKCQQNQHLLAKIPFRCCPWLHRNLYS